VECPAAAMEVGQRTGAGQSHTPLTDYANGV